MRITLLLSSLQGCHARIWNYHLSRWPIENETSKTSKMLSDGQLLAGCLYVYVRMICVYVKGAPKVRTYGPEWGSIDYLSTEECLLVPSVSDWMGKAKFSSPISRFCDSYVRIVCGWWTKWTNVDVANKARHSSRLLYSEHRRLVKNRTIEETVAPSVLILSSTHSSTLSRAITTALTTRSPASACSSCPGSTAPGRRR